MADLAVRLRQRGPDSLDAALTDESFDPDNIEHLQALYNSLARLLRTSPSFYGRVIGGMCYVIMWDQNQIVDPNSDTLDLHPRITEALRLANESQAQAVPDTQVQDAKRWNAMKHLFRVGNLNIDGKHTWLGPNFGKLVGATMNEAADKLIGGK
jgi:hypothetical protein